MEKKENFNHATNATYQPAWHFRQEPASVRHPPSYAARPVVLSQRKATKLTQCCTSSGLFLNSLASRFTERSHFATVPAVAAVDKPPLSTCHVDRAYEEKESNNDRAFDASCVVKKKKKNKNVFVASQQYQ